ncbi:hypothetical protein MBANPS3_006739 [Mucor bainieri]
MGAASRQECSEKGSSDSREAYDIGRGDGNTVQYLNAYDTAYNATLPTSAISTVAAAASSQLFVKIDGGKSLSILEDLGKVRRVDSHYHTMWL